MMAAMGKWFTNSLAMDHLLVRYPGFDAFEIFNLYTDHLT